MLVALIRILVLHTGLHEPVSASLASRNGALQYSLDIRWQAYGSLRVGSYGFCLLQKFRGGDGISGKRISSETRACAWLVPARSRRLLVLAVTYVLVGASVCTGAFGFPFSPAAFFASIRSRPYNNSTSVLP